MKPLEQDHELDQVLPAEELLKAVGFRRRAYGRILLYLKEHGSASLSPRQLMNLFIPAPPFSTFIPYTDAPIFGQSQFGKYCYDSALLSLCEAKLGGAFEREWASRLHFWKVAEIRASGGNKSSQRRVSD
jgi:hypothetical protein